MSQLDQLVHQADHNNRKEERVLATKSWNFQLPAPLSEQKLTMKALTRRHLCSYEHVILEQHFRTLCHDLFRRRLSLGQHIGVRRRIEPLR